MVRGLKDRLDLMNSPGMIITGFQPLGSIIMADTQAVGLGFLIVRRWRGGKHASPLAREIGQCPSDIASPVCG